MREVAVRLRKDASELFEDEILLIAKISDAMAHPARIKIYRFIMKCNKERSSVCNKDIVAEFDYSQATISQHLKKLIESELIQVRKSDKYSMYFANFGILVKYLNATKKFE